MLYTASWPMLLRKINRLLVLLFVLICAPALFGQESRDVDDLTLESVSSTVTRLSWTPIEPVDCAMGVTYNVYRGNTEDFDPSARNRIASGLTKATYVAKEPVPSQDYYYYVKAVLTPVTCALRSGKVVVYPLDLGETYALNIGKETGSCKATSTKELVCSGAIPNFQAVIASQGNHEYLIGCEFDNYETCANLSGGVYTIAVHNRSLTVLDSGMERINTQTGKKISGIIPVFSVLARVK